MELNRNHYFLVGMVLVLFGVQLRLVDSVLLTPESTRFVAERLEGKKAVAGGQSFTSLMTIASPAQGRRISPPRWLGWSFISVGAVLVLQSLAMKKPDSN